MIVSAIKIGYMYIQLKKMYFDTTRLQLIMFVEGCYRPAKRFMSLVNDDSSLSTVENMRKQRKRTGNADRLSKMQTLGLHYMSVHLNNPNDTFSGDQSRYSNTMKISNSLTSTPFVRRVRDVR